MEKPGLKPWMEVMPLSKPSIAEFTTILASNQIRKAGNMVHNWPTAFGGQQCLLLASGVCLKLHYKKGVLVLKLKKPTEGDLFRNSLHKLTPEEGWEPRKEKDAAIKKEEINKAKP